MPQEILQGGQQKGSELALLSIGTGVDLVFNQIREKTLGKVLRIVDGVPAAAHETVKRRPVSFAKLRERGLRNFRGGLVPSSRENHAPMRRSERIALVTGGPRQSFHVSGVTGPYEKGKP